MSRYCHAIATASNAIAQAADLAEDALDLETNIAALRWIATAARKAGKSLPVDLQDDDGVHLETAVKLVIEVGTV